MTVQPTPVPTGTGTGPAPQPSGGGGGGIGAAFTRKLGPLPVWAWAVVIGGAGLGWRLMRGGGGGGGGTNTVQQIPTTYLPDSTQAGFINELSLALKRIEDRIGGGTTAPTSPQVPQAWNFGFDPWEPPINFDLGAWLVKFRAANPNLYQMYLSVIGAKQTPDETAQQRQERLLKEAQFYANILKNPVPVSAKP